MRRTEKSQANSRQKSKANSRQKSTANGRPTRRNTVQKKAAASDTDVQQGQGEVITTIPKIDFDEEIGEYRKIIQTAQKQRLRKSRRP